MSSSSRYSTRSKASRSPGEIGHFDYTNLSPERLRSRPSANRSKKLTPEPPVGSEHAHLPTPMPSTPRKERVERALRADPRRLHAQTGSGAHEHPIPVLKSTENGQVGASSSSLRKSSWHSDGGASRKNVHYDLSAISEPANARTHRARSLSPFRSPREQTPAADNDATAVAEDDDSEEETPRQKALMYLFVAIIYPILIIYAPAVASLLTAWYLVARMEERKAKLQRASSQADGQRQSMWIPQRTWSDVMPSIRASMYALVRVCMNIVLFHALYIFAATVLHGLRAHLDTGKDDIGFLPRLFVNFMNLDIILGPGGYQRLTNYVNAEVMWWVGCWIFTITQKVFWDFPQAIWTKIAYLIETTGEGVGIRGNVTDASNHTLISSHM